MLTSTSSYLHVNTSSGEQAASVDKLGDSISQQTLLLPTFYQTLTPQHWQGQHSRLP